ncbi:DUF397 domain-containing protein [Saccharopolyspora spinosa]|uniref:Uncharacterized protein DUF397 n=1 Tax=Saccharopolyspora spinosa TaxID=60894 RepID=A0A2N3XZ60_SACSN|nr:DUF397 domain-containing protein [Saccharopolyspora spinosa]PKW15900.1 uncharacterized protein DUF397 [Saccharopolyspora spinosa]
MYELGGAVWRKSSRSAGSGQCVEVAQNLADMAAVRDSKNPREAALIFAKADFAKFLTNIKFGKFDN